MTTKSLSARFLSARFVHQAISIVATDLLYGVGILFFSWHVFDILVILWVESVLQAVMGLFRLLIAGGTLFIRRLQIAVFFSVGGALFSLAFGLFAFVFYSDLNVPGDREASLAAMAGLLTSPSVVISALCILACLVYEFFAGYIGAGAYRKAQGEWEMVHVGLRQPLLLMGLMFGGAILEKHGNPVPGLLLVLILKMGVEFLSAFHRAFQPPAVAVEQSGT